MNYEKSLKAIESNVKLVINITNGFEKLEKALKENKIINPEYQDLKYIFNRFISEVYEQGIDKKYSYAGKYKDLTEELQYISSPNDVRGVGAYYKKMIKFSQESKDMIMYKESMEITDELLPLVEKFKKLKDYVVSASSQKKEKISKEEEEKNQWHKKYLSHKDTKEIFHLLEIKLSDKKIELEKQFMEKYELIINFYLENKDKKSIKEMFEKDIVSWIVMENFLEKKKKNEYVLKDNYKDVMQNLANYNAEKIINHFVYKNTEKLATIIYEKNNLLNHDISNIKVRQGVIECEVTCIFKDSSRFTAKTGLVLSYSKYGKPFYRYPTIFQNVKLPNGQNMDNPSEENMNKLFVEKEDVKKLKL